MKHHDIRPELVAFSSGAFVMIFEILWSRIVWPYIGTSLFVWTSLIALILWALSLWHYYGGLLSDKRASFQDIALVFLGCAFALCLLIAFKEHILLFIVQRISDIRLSSIIIAFILFSPVSFLLGMLSPIVTKIRMTRIETWGQVIGKIWSIGTIGSIIGTLGAGFFLIPFFGVHTLLLLLAWACIILSWICEPKKYIWFQIFTVICLMFQYFLFEREQLLEKKSGTYTYDTPYSHITISEVTDTQNGKKVRNLQIDNITHAGMFLENNDLVYEYTKYYHLHDVLFPTSKKVLLLWGAAYSYPKNFLESYPDKTLDVVEIDEKISEIAQKHFRLEENPRLKIYHEDARVFLNRNQEKYDVILGDAFGSYFSVPYQLTTQEVVQKKYDMLSESGVVLLNLIGSLSGETSLFVNAEYNTYKTIFDEVFLLPVRSIDAQRVQNIILVAAKNKESLSFDTKNKEYAYYLSKKQYLNTPNRQILTDNFAPVDYYVGKMIQ